MRLKTKILKALDSGPKQYKDIVKLAKSEKQALSCLTRMRKAGALALRVKDGENEYSLPGKRVGTEAHMSPPPGDRRCALRYRSPGQARRRQRGDLDRAGRGGIFHAAHVHRARDRDLQPIPGMSR